MILSVLWLANRILSSAILITAFSLGLYILRHNYRSNVGRAFCILLASVMIVYLGDVVIFRAQSPESTLIWLRFQWVGIAFVPAVYLHFSDALLNVTSSGSKWRRWAVLVSYVVSGITLLAVILTPWVVRDAVVAPLAPYLRPGPLFWPFALLFFAVVVIGAANVNRARARCLISTSRRRMAYLALSFAGPALGVFPYMLLNNTLSVAVPEALLLAILLLGNIGVVAMIVVMSYTVAYFGAFTPDRVIKYGLIEYILRGPLLASLVLVILLSVPHVETFLGLPGDLVTLFAAGLTIILMQFAINVARPFLNRIVYRKDLAEIAWLQELDKRLLTPSDLEQFLENVLSSLAELLRVRYAFVVIPADQELHLEAHCGEERVARSFLRDHDLTLLLQRCQHDPEASLEFESLDGFLVRSLCTRNRDAVLGLLIVQRWVLAPEIGDEWADAVQDLIEQAEFALEDSHLQQGIFVALQQIMPDIERIQKQRQLMRYVSSLPRPIQESPVSDPSFDRWVKDALSHYWGGPKLTDSPLLNLTVVGRARDLSEGDAVRALRSVLEQAIEALRPQGEQKMTAVEWTLYNILDLKFRQGHRMSDIANRLAISESDLYRKQRAAIKEVARMLAQMEQRAQAADPYNDP
jgi:hypothetical protein